MKKKWTLITSIINTILLAVCLVQINDLRIELSNTRSNLGTQLSNVLTNVNNSYSYIEDVLEQEASIVSSAEWEYGAVDVKAGTVELRVKVTPKEYQPEVTQTVFVCGEKEIPAEYENGTYVVTMNVPLYEDVEISSVLFRENEIIRTERLGWFFSPRGELLPYVYANMYGTTHLENAESEEDMGKWTFSGDVEVDVKRSKLEEIEVEKVEIVRMLDGKEVERFDVTMDAMIAYNTFSYNWNQSYEIPCGSVQEIYVEVIMSGDIVYRSQVDYCEMTGPGENIPDEGQWEHLEAAIYDVEGNLLYSIDEKLYK